MSRELIHNATFEAHLVVNHHKVSNVIYMRREDEDELSCGVSTYWRNRVLNGYTNRLEQRLRRVSEDERETNDDGSKWHERCEGVVAIKDEQTDEDEDEYHDREQDRI